MSGGADWAAERGDVWAQRWRDTDAGLLGVEPYLLAAVTKAAPPVPFRAFEIGCGAGTTTRDVAIACRHASVLACDLSASLVHVAKGRLFDLGSIDLVVGDAVRIAPERGPFDLIYSRHGVMFFNDPVAAFGALRRACVPGARLIFSCFAEWESNPWASELAEAAVGHRVPAPGREPGGFAFSEPVYVERILRSSGWEPIEQYRADFDYVAGAGGNAIEDALGFLSEIGPASAAMHALPEAGRGSAMKRMRHALVRRHSGGRIAFPAAAWVWTARAGDAPA